MTKSKVCIIGIGGRMGQRVMRLIQDHPTLELIAGVEHATKSLPDLKILVTSDASKAIALCDVVIDFSAPSSVAQIAPICAQLGKNYVIASTALTAADETALNAAAQNVAILQAANLSTGVNVLLELVELAAKRLGKSFDIEISEIHHKHKRDAPSGTSLALGQAVQRGHGPMQEVRARQDGERKSDELGYAVMRGGDVSGDHTVHFFGEGERIELVHRSSSADIFAAGALRAAAWLVEKANGRYSMRDVMH
jgi:4-hydroxy-tetrahydrodipicolinate reductase